MDKPSTSRNRPLELAVVFAIVAAPTLAFGYGSGITGYSGQTGGMICNNCHSGGPAPTVTINGPKTLAAGQVGQYTATATVSQSGKVSFVGGIDVSVDDAQALLAADTQTTSLRSGELTHNQGLPYTKVGQSYSLSIPFSLKAPGSAGTVKIYVDMVAGAGQAMPTPDYGTAVSLEVTVEGGSAADGGAASTDAGDGAGEGADAAPAAGGDDAGAPAVGSGGNGDDGSGAPMNGSSSQGGGCSFVAVATGGPLVELALSSLLLGLALSRRRRR